MHDIAAIVLAGGRSRRMGADKALLEWGGGTLVAHVTGVLRTAVDGPVVVVRGVGQTLPPLPGVELAYDALPDAGPLEGLRAGLRALDRRAEIAFVASVDLPLLRPALVRCVVGALRADPQAQLAAPEVGGRVQPLAAAYRLSILPALEQLLAAGERRVVALVEQCRTVVLDEDALLSDPGVLAADPRLESLVDADTAGELAAARRRAPSA